MIRSERMTVVHQAKIAHNIFELTLQGELVQDMAPGQFVHVRVGKVLSRFYDVQSVLQILIKI